MDGHLAVHMDGHPAVHHLQTDSIKSVEARALDVVSEISELLYSYLSL
jgi:hypothetical protein